MRTVPLDLSTPPGGNDWIRGLVSTARDPVRYMDMNPSWYFRLAKVLTGAAASLADRCGFIPCTVHRCQRNHVDMVCERVGLTPDPGRVERAVGNIAPDIYRCWESTRPAGYRRIHDRSPAGPVFESLIRHDGIGAWPELLRLRER